MEFFELIILVIVAGMILAYFVDYFLTNWIALKKKWKDRND